MNDYKKVKDISKSLNESLDHRDATGSLHLFEELQNAYKSEFGEKLMGVESVEAWFEMMTASIHYFSFNNFYDNAKRNFEELKKRYESYRNDRHVNENDKNLIEKIFIKAQNYARALKSHKNQTLPRESSRCYLCGQYPANKTGSHMVPNLLTAPTFTFDGVAKRNREAYDHSFLNALHRNTSYYGPEVSLDRIIEMEGHELSDQELG